MEFDPYLMQAGDVITSQCLSCRHKHPGLGTCEAFRDGIPANVLQNHTDHRQSIPGDNGVRYEREPNSGFKNPFDGSDTHDREKAGVIADIITGAVGDDAVDLIHQMGTESTDGSVHAPESTDQKKNS